MKKIIIFLLFIFVLFSFWEINKLNYIKHKQIQESIVNHPEWLATKEFAKNTSFWYKNLKADIYRLETIQYIWWNAVSSEYKKYLYKILDLITELNPYFDHPYKIWMLLLPDYNDRYEDLSNNEQKENISQSEKIWLKWVKNFCDTKKIELIDKQDDLRKIWTEDIYKNPCKNYEIPYYLAFNYYYYLHDPLKASLYYKVASANTDSLEWAKILAAIMQWKWWNREKAYFMFLNIWKTLDKSDDKICSTYTSELEKLWANIWTNKLILNWEILDTIAKTRDKFLWVEKEDATKADSDCANYARKATRELNLYYIEKANEKYKLDNAWTSAYNAKILFDSWYIDYLPIDFQQEKDYWIIYKYNEETKNFDYEMGKY